MAPNFVSDGGSAPRTKVIVFDIDGTLANIEHRKHYVASKPKNWAAFNAGMEHDTPKHEVMETLRLYAQKYIIVLCSGREETYRVPTEDWLARQGLYPSYSDGNVSLIDRLRPILSKPTVEFPFRRYENLYMRPKGDYRADDIVKEELLDQMLSDGYDPHIIFDDRDRVVAMWRRRGYTCFQVAPGDF